MIRWLAIPAIVLAVALPVTAMPDPGQGGSGGMTPAIPLSASTSGGGTYAFAEEVTKGEERGGFTFRMVVKGPAFTVGAVAASDIRAHRHSDGAHVLYIVSGRGVITLDGQTVDLRPGLIVYVPRGVVHSVKKTTPSLQFIDFAQPAFNPANIEWIR